ncbi:hypothetical protein KP509_20G046200 [Ceratopteris richardii]|uniref:NADH dehydrogenase [ubiquinone] 1 beta subcomplex subunit 2 n=1 Tax=Ceratopteris richardii TaxID=49495 RepID=A0A8T2SFM8_CERRI|nr:hypothetical protein KP509_20G046200 [Ceratopteris richardii]
MAGHGHDAIHFHPPKRWQVRTGQIMGAIMWFWVFYRAKQDGPVLLGWRHPWDHHGHGHGHGHAETHEHTHGATETSKSMLLVLMKMLDRLVFCR